MDNVEVEAWSLAGYCSTKSRPPQDLVVLRRESSHIDPSDAM